MTIVSDRSYALNHQELRVRIYSDKNIIIYSIIPSLDHVGQIYNSLEKQDNESRCIDEYQKIYDMNRQFKQRNAEQNKLSSALGKVNNSNFIALFEKYMNDKRWHCGVIAALHQDEVPSDASMHLNVKMFYPCDDLTKILFFKNTSSPSGFGMYLDMSNMTVTNIFCGDLVEKVAFFHDPRLLAYSVRPDPAVEKSIVKIVNASNFSSRILDEYNADIEDIAISADDSLIAVLYTKSDVGEGPIESMFAKFGHGMSYSTFTLVIYDKSGIVMYSKLLAPRVPYGSASLTWVNDGK
jgi:hypothetical protein